MTTTTLAEAPARRRLSLLPILRAVGQRLFGKGKWLAWLLMAGLVVVRFWDPQPVQLLRLKLIDTFQQISPRDQGEFQVMVADIDEASLRKIGQWPWPRPLLGTVVERLMQAGAVVVGFDMFFSEPDRLSPPRFAAANPELDPAVRKQLEAAPDTDEAFARIINQYHAVLGQSGGQLGEDHGAPPGKPALAWINADPRPFLMRFATIVGNTPVLESAAVGRGITSTDPDPDGLIRRIPAAVAVGDGVYPTLAIEMLRVAFGSTTLIVKSDPAVADTPGVQFIGLQFPDKPNIIIPTDPQGRLLPHFAKYNPARYVSMVDIAGPGYDPGKLQAKVEGKLVFVGTSASGLRDIRATPVDMAEPGVEVNAQLIESILADSLLRQPDWAPGLEVVLTFLACLLMIVGVGGARGTLALGAVVAAGLLGGSWYYFSRENLMFDAAYPALSAFLVYVAVTFLNYVREEKQKKEIQSAFGQYLSPELVAKLAANPDQLELGGEMRDMTIFFSDVRGFSTFSEMFDAQGLTMFMNKYLTPMTEIAQNHRAYIDKYIGDAIMAFWNAPLDDPQHARMACLTVLRMRERLTSLQEELNPILKEAADARARALGRPVPVPKLAIGMGVNTGECVVGNMGSHQKTNYSVLGDTVNLASRLEGQTKPYHLDNLIGEHTMVLVPEMASLEIDLLQVKGKTEPVRVFTLVGDETVAATAPYRALKTVHDEMLAAYRRQDWAAVEGLLQACREAAGPFHIAMLYDSYQERMAEMIEHPPGADWDGVYVAKTK